MDAGPPRVPLRRPAPVGRDRRGARRRPTAVRTGGVRRGRVAVDAGTGVAPAPTRAAPDRTGPARQGFPHTRHSTARAQPWSRSTAPATTGPAAKAGPARHHHAPDRHGTDPQDHPRTRRPPNARPAVPATHPRPAHTSGGPPVPWRTGPARSPSRWPQRRARQGRTGATAVTGARRGGVGAPLRRRDRHRGGPGDLFRLRVGPPVARGRERAIEETRHVSSRGAGTRRRTSPSRSPAP